jgi:hypothetical protein
MIQYHAAMGVSPLAAWQIINERDLFEKVL